MSLEKLNAGMFVMPNRTDKFVCICDRIAWLGILLVLLIDLQHPIHPLIKLMAIMLPASTSAYLLARMARLYYDQYKSG